MGLFKKQTSSISSSRISSFTLNDGFITNSWMYGSFRTLSKPSMLYYNGSTYSLYYSEKANNNAVGIIKQTGDTIVNYAVNTGTATPEPFNHPAPLLHINKSTGYIYVLQNTFHIDTIKVWKSDSPENISSFSYVGYFGSSNTSYLGHLEGDNSDVVIVTRAGEFGVDNYSISVINVNLDTLSYTQTQVTDVTGGTDMRHYLLVPYQYGTSTRTYFGVSTRNESPTGSGYYKFSLFSTVKGGSWKEFKNIANTYSKDVTSSPITTIELENNYAAIGSDSDRTTIISEGKMIVLNDDIYLVYVSDDVNDRWSVRKFTYGSATTSDFLIPLTTIVRSPIWYGSVYMRYNGSNFVFSIWEHDGFGGYITKLYGCDINFSNWTEFSYDTEATSITEPNQGIGCFYGMPTNLHEAVESEDKYLLIGKEEGTSRGNFKYVITNESFNT